MGKYRQTVDITGHNSVAMILNHIKSGSSVIEFGCSNGYMTEYLKDQMNCTVHVVEINQEDGEQALGWAETGLVGPIDGDIEKYHWKTFFDSCDYVIFSDVLEHLYDPWEVLKESTSLLEENGSIIISVPNVSHNSIIIDLINNKFDYRPLGLLDNTHIRFFTRESLLAMVSGAGLRIVNEYNTYCPPNHTEFQNFLDDVPEPVAAALSNRPDGNLYQFVWELKKD